MEQRNALHLPPLLARKAASLRLRVRALLGRGALPNAIIIGAMKSGTTSLFDYLVQHPQVCGSRTKELHFFDNQHDKGERWYRANFTPRGEKILLESSPYYLFHPLAPERAARLVPHAKLIVLLRDPVDRAYSHFNQNAEEGLEPLSFEEALDREAERLAGTEEALASGRLSRSHAHQTFSYAAKGRYAGQLKRWLSHFPRERMLILKAEEFFGAPQQGVDVVTDFLELERFRIPDATPGNQRRYPLMHPDTRRRLERVFEAPDKVLGRLTGLSWQRRPQDGPLQPGEIDLESPHWLQAPWEAHDAVRAHGAAVWLPRQRFWLVVSHAAVSEALERPDTFSSVPHRALDPVLGGADPPAHARGRRLVEEVFASSGRAVSAAVAEAENRFQPQVEAVSGLAGPVARAAVAALLGIRPEAVPASTDFEQLSSALLGAAPEADAYHGWLADGATADDAASLFRTVWLAGAIPLERTIAWAVYELLRVRERDSLLPDRLPAFIEEVMRLHPPLQMTARRCVADAQLAGTTIPAGAAVQLCLGAANRDPAVFDAPHGLNLGRGANPHLSFGAGPHGCPGAALAKAVLRAVVCRLLEAGPESGDGEVRFLQTVEALAPASLPIRLRRLDRA